MSLASLRREEPRDLCLKSRRLEPDQAIAQDAGFEPLPDRVCGGSSRAGRRRGSGNARRCEERNSRRASPHDRPLPCSARASTTMTGFGISIAVSGGEGQTTIASGSKALRGVILTVMPSGNMRQGNSARRIPASSAFWAVYFVRSGAIMTGWPSRSSQRPSRPSAQRRNASTSISFFAGLDMRHLTIADGDPRSRQQLPVYAGGASKA
jgi:hypothetical protein